MSYGGGVTPPPFFLVAKPRPPFVCAPPRRRGGGSPTPSSPLAQCPSLEEVVFNGRVPQDYETFAFPGHFGEWNFCKTGPDQERKRPYDLAVRVFLLIAKLHLGEAMTLSGNAPLADWAEAASLIEDRLLLPVDVYWALEQVLLRVEDGRGKVFLVEAKRNAPWEKLKNHLARLEPLHPLGLLFWPFQGPYRLLGEERLPQEDFSRLYAGSFYQALLEKEEGQG